MGKFRLTADEKAWILYDVGNSAFILLASTILPIYYNALAESAGISSVDYLASWGYAVSAATLIGAAAGMILGGISDQKGYKKRLFAVCVAVGAAACAALGLAATWQWFLGIFVAARVAYSDSLVCYDAMLPDIAPEERLDRVSSQGYAWGYIGSCIPFAVCLFLCLGYETLGLSLGTAMMIAFLITALWWAGAAVPLFRRYRQVHYAEAGGHPVRDSFRRLGRTFSQVKGQKHIFLFLLAFFFFIDGVYTIIDMATAYGTALGLDTPGLLAALLVTQVVAFPCSILFGRLAGRFSAKRLIEICILAYLGIAVYGIFLQNQLQFYILAVCVGIFQGGIQSLSRSYYASLIPAEQAGEYFGLFDICGKGASFMGTFLVGAVSQATGSMNLGVGALAVIFGAGFVLLRALPAAREMHNI